MRAAERKLEEMDKRVIDLMRQNEQLDTKK